MEEANLTPENTQKSAPVSSKPKRSVWRFFVLGFVVICALALGAMYYITTVGVQTLSQTPFVVSSAKIFRAPLARVNGEKIPYAEYVDDRVAL